MISAEIYHVPFTQSLPGPKVAAQEPRKQKGRDEVESIVLLAPHVFRPLVTRIDCFCPLPPWSDRNQFYNKYSNLPLLPNGTQRCPESSGTALCRPSLTCVTCGQSH